MGKTKTRILVVSQAGPFCVLRALHNLHYEIYVLGTGAKLIALSRLCKKYFHFDLKSNKDLVETVQRICAKYKIEIIFPIEVPLVITLNKNHHRIHTKVFPSADHHILAMLNNKWRFFQTLRKLQFSTPKTILVKSLNDLQSVSFKKPYIIKPLEESGGRGVCKITNQNDLEQYSNTYIQSHQFPYVMQEFIEGHDVSVGMLAKEGNVLAWEVHRWVGSAQVDFLDHKAARILVERFVRTIKYTGLINFDMRIDTKNNIYFLECNPRVWASLHMAMLAGVNFIQIALQINSETVVGMKNTSYVAPKQIVKMAVTNPMSLRNISRISYKDFFDAISDGVPYVLERLPFQKKTL